MIKRNKLKYVVIFLLLSAFLLFCIFKTVKTDRNGQISISLQDYLKKSENDWFLTGKKEYQIQAMMVSKKTSFHNEYEVADYTVEDDGETVILKGTCNELWASKLNKVIETYTKADGSTIDISDFENKDTYIDLLSKAIPDSYYAMFVPPNYSVTVETAWGDILHTNLENAPHDKGDFLVCRVDKDGNPDLSDIWILNGVIFYNTYDTANLP